MHWLYVVCIFPFILRCMQVKVGKHKLTWDWNPQPILMYTGGWWAAVAQGCCLWMIYQFIWLKKRYYTWYRPQRLKGQRGWHVTCPSERRFSVADSPQVWRRSWRSRGRVRLRLTWRPSRFTLLFPLCYELRLESIVLPHWLHWRACCIVSQWWLTWW